MIKIRVIKIAKLLNISCVEIVNVLRLMGQDVHSINSSINEDAIRLLLGYYFEEYNRLFFRKLDTLHSNILFFELNNIYPILDVKLFEEVRNKLANMTNDELPYKIPIKEKENQLSNKFNLRNKADYNDPRVVPLKEREQILKKYLKKLEGTGIKVKIDTWGRPLFYSCYPGNWISHRTVKEKILKK